MYEDVMMEDDEEEIKKESWRRRKTQGWRWDAPRNIWCLRQTGIVKL